MKKYKLLKDLPGINKGEESIANAYGFTREFLIEKGFIEEIEEGLRPKFKVGDYAVYKKMSPRGTVSTRYIKIIDIKIVDNNNITKYNLDSNGGYFSEEELRSPTEKELEKYFR